MEHLVKNVLPILFLLMLSGCSLNPYGEYRAWPLIPERLEEKGLLVGEFQGVGRLSDVDDDFVSIKGVARWVRLSRNHLGIALPPGEYEIRSLRQEKGYETDVRPIKRKFKIESGKITNLGLTVLVPDREDIIAKKHFYYFFIDNSADMENYLRENYPQLTSYLNDDAMFLANGNYVSGDNLEKFQTYVSACLFEESQGKSEYVVGPAGVLSSLKRDNRGKIIGFNKIASPTMSGPVLHAENKDHSRFSFLTEDRLFMVENNQVSRFKPPKTVDYKEMFLVGKRGIIIVDTDFKLHISIDNGETWKTISQYASKSSADVVLIKEKDQCFICNKTSPTVLVYPYGALDVSQIEVPEGLTYIKKITNRNGKLFLEVYTPPFYKSDKTHLFYVLYAGEKKLQSLYMPDEKCSDGISFLDQDGIRMTTVCQERREYISENGGLEWHLRPLEL